jgi:hypothetical protein
MKELTKKAFIEARAESIQNEIRAANALKQQQKAEDQLVGAAVKFVYMDEITRGVVVSVERPGIATVAIGIVVQGTLMHVSESGRPRFLLINRGCDCPRIEIPIKYLKHEDEEIEQ